jgi:hypothetical protein
VTPEEYAAQQAFISAQILNYMRAFATYFTVPHLSVKDWLNVLRTVWPAISQARDQSSTLARSFYDSQRSSVHPSIPRNDRPLEGSEFQEFVKNMEPARVRMSQPSSPQDAAARFALRGVREVENAGRQQIIHAVENDDGVQELQKAEAEAKPDAEPKVIRGWARVATGRYTCAWCLMLISRGPTYLGADTAGLDLPDYTAQKMIAAGEDVSEYMQQWHDGCDCKVVPVFKSEGWFGEADSKRALAAWNDATKEANRIQDSDDGPTVSPSGKNKGKEMNLNQEALNALRRRLNSGDISMSDFAALAPAA